MELMYGCLLIFVALELLRCDAMVMRGPLQRTRRKPGITDSPHIVEESNTNGLYGLSTLRLNFNELRIYNLPDDFVDSQNPVSLNLSNNGIETVSPNAFALLPNLRSLDLSKNRLRVRDLLFQLSSSSLETLKLQFQSTQDQYGGQTCIDAFDVLHFRYLEKLDLRGCGEVVKTLCAKLSAPRLTHLDLSMSDMGGDEFIGNLPLTITHLFLDNSRMRTLSTNLFESIEELSLNHNYFKFLCFDVCRSLSSPYFSPGHQVTVTANTLKRLHLSGNDIEEILIGERTEFASLELLDLSNNMINYIDPSFTHALPNLKNLSLSGNSLLSIPSMCSMRSLGSLDLSNNNIDAFFSETTCVYVNLKRLNLRGNSISVLGNGGMNCFPALIELDLSNNRLVNFPRGWLHEDNKLEILWLVNNRFHTSGRPNLPQLRHLKELYIQKEASLSFYSSSAPPNIARNLTVHLLDLEVGRHVELLTAGAQPGITVGFDNHEQ